MSITRGRTPVLQATAPPPCRPGDPSPRGPRGRSLGRGARIREIREGLGLTLAAGPLRDAWGNRIASGVEGVVVTYGCTSGPSGP